MDPWTKHEEIDHAMEWNLWVESYRTEWRVLWNTEVLRITDSQLTNKLQCCFSQRLSVSRLSDESDYSLKSTNRILKFDSRHDRVSKLFFRIHAQSSSTGRPIINPSSMFLKSMCDFKASPQKILNKEECREQHIATLVQAIMCHPHQVAVTTELKCNNPYMTFNE